MNYTGMPVYEIRPDGRMKAQLGASLRYAHPGPLRMNYRLRRYAKSPRNHNSSGGFLF